MNSQNIEKWSETGVEPALEDVLSDQIFHLVAVRDRLCVNETRQFLLKMASSLRQQNVAVAKDSPR